MKLALDHHCPKLIAAGLREGKFDVVTAFEMDWHTVCLSCPTFPASRHRVWDNSRTRWLTPDSLCTARKQIKVDKFLPVPGAAIRVASCIQRPATAGALVFANTRY